MLAVAEVMEGRLTRVGPYASPAIEVKRDAR
jgi:hypothetical protein